MRWYRQVQFISAVPMPDEWADELGTTVNGMWAAPEKRSPEAVAKSYDSGQRVLFSVPLIALTPSVYRSGSGRYLLADVLTKYMTQTGGRVISYGDARNAPGRNEDEAPLLRFWRDYRVVDRERILASVEMIKDTRLTCSDPLVNVIRSAGGGLGGEQILHLLNYSYDAAADEVRSVRGLQVRLPWLADLGATCTLLRPGREEQLSSTTDNGQLVVRVPELDIYGLMLVREARTR